MLSPNPPRPFPFSPNRPLLAVCLALSSLAAPPPGAAGEPERIVLLRSVTLAIELIDGAPRLVLVARGPSSPHGQPATLRHVVDPSRCALHPEPYRQEAGPGSARWLSWHHLVWRDGGRDRVIGSVLAVRNEMPGPGQSSRYELLSLPRATYGFETVTQTFSFEPDLARSPVRPAFGAAGDVRGSTVLIAGCVPESQWMQVESAVTRLGGQMAFDPLERIDVIVVPREIDFVDGRDAQIEVMARRGARVIYAEELVKWGEGGEGERRERRRKA